ncbi:MAG: hypothetical protein HC913_11395 [Microscillaceae bacterium]|nr:hypothetical protein [Microscillaceae bacterium]
MKKEDPFTMDEVLAQILLLSIGLGFLFWLQTEPSARRKQTQKIPLVPAPARLFWQRTATHSGPSSALMPPYVLWRGGLPPQSSSLSKTDLRRIVCRLGWAELGTATPAQWQGWPLEAIEVVPGVDLPSAGGDFSDFKQAWRAYFPGLAFRAQAGFAKPQSSFEQAWNAWLLQHQFYLEGYLLDISDVLACHPLKTLAQHWQAASQALQPGQSLALHCTLPAEGLGTVGYKLWELLSFSHLAYLTLAIREGAVSPPAAFFWQYLAWSQLGRKWQSLRQMGSEDTLRAYAWQKDWELGAWLYNADSKNQVLWLEAIFPENFYVAMYSGENFESLAPRKARNRLVLPPQTWAWLSTHPPAMLGASHPTLLIRRTAPTAIEVGLAIQKAGFPLYLRLLDTKGQEVFAWGQKAARAGTFYLDLEVSHLPEGLYYWIQEAEGQWQWQAWDYAPALPEL